MTDAELVESELFDAAVSYSLRRGKLNVKPEADPRKSRSSGVSFVLAAADDPVIDRIQLDKLYRDAEKMQDVYLPDIGKNFPAIGKAVSILIFIGLLVRCSSLISGPSEPSDWLTDGSAWASSEVALKYQLRDPDTYQRVGEKAAIRSEGGTFWTWSFRARNGFGGMNVGSATCEAKRAGETVKTQVMAQ